MPRGPWGGGRMRIYGRDSGECQIVVAGPGFEEILSVTVVPAPSTGVLQLPERLSGSVGEPIPLPVELAWSPPDGIEVTLSVSDPTAIEVIRSAKVIPEGRKQAWFTLLPLRPGTTCCGRNARWGRRSRCSG